MITMTIGMKLKNGQMESSHIGDQKFNNLVQLFNFIGVETDIILFINNTCLLSPIMHETLKGYAESKT